MTANQMVKQMDNYMKIVFVKGLWGCLFVEV